MKTLKQLDDLGAIRLHKKKCIYIGAIGVRERTCKETIDQCSEATLDLTKVLDRDKLEFLICKSNCPYEWTKNTCKREKRRCTSVIVLADEIIKNANSLVKDKE